MSEKDKLKQLLKGIPLISKKPSQLLSDMKSMALHKLTDGAIYALLIEKLPPALPPNLAVLDDLRLEQLAKMADSILPQIDKNDTVISALTHPCKNSSSELINLYTKMQILEKRISSLFREFKARRLQFNHQRSASRRRSSSCSPRRNTICFYHKRLVIGPTNAPISVVTHSSIRETMIAVHNRGHVWQQSFSSINAESRLHIHDNQVYLIDSGYLSQLFLSRNSAAVYPNHVLSCTIRRNFA